MERMTIDRNLPLDSTFERESDWRGGPQRHPELGIASVVERRPADQVYTGRCGRQPDLIALGELFGTGK